MSSAYSPSVELDCSPSRWLRAALVVLALAAAAALWLSAVRWLMPAVPVLAWLAWRQTGAAAAIGPLRFGADGSVRLGASDALCTLAACVERGPLVLVALRSSEYGTLRLCFGPDRCSASQRRQLRLWLQRHRDEADPLPLAGVR